MCDAKSPPLVTVIFWLCYWHVWDLHASIFFFFRVAKEEEHNKMSPSSLAIVFAPCVLRSPDVNDPFLGMKDVSKTTMWVMMHTPLTLQKVLFYLCVIFSWIQITTASYFICVLHSFFCFHGYNLIHPEANCCAATQSGRSAHVKSWR